MIVLPYSVSIDEEPVCPACMEAYFQKLREEEKAYFQKRHKEERVQ